jgi:hypothetical protein
MFGFIANRALIESDEEFCGLFSVLKYQKA